MYVDAVPSPPIMTQHRRPRAPLDGETLQNVAVLVQGARRRASAIAVVGAGPPTTPEWRGW